ncbi:hypothetical protein [Alteribacillus sp. YIM 98480]|uniref:hypothetical protein n=1 Tax=Alteribacillus sp. YIM 98480 TaxID=2606599 RepID=UPI00131E0330|nr:hypothetical protein [Alteribacillus sp. YIM 98480]
MKETFTTEDGCELRYLKSVYALTLDDAYKKMKDLLSGDMRCALRPIRIETVGFFAPPRYEILIYDYEKVAE